MRKLTNTFTVEDSFKHSSQHEISFNSFRKRCDLLHNQLNWSFKLRVYFAILAAALQNKDGIQNAEFAKVVSKTFLNAFASLSEKEKQNFMFTQIQFVNESFKNRNQDQQKQYSEESAIKSIETECLLKKYMAGMAYWVTVKFSFDGDLRTVKICCKKKEYIIDLRKYLIRKSKLQKSSLILVKCSQNPNEQQNMAFFFNEQLFPQIYLELDLCIMLYRNQQLLDLVGVNNQNQRISEISIKNVTHEKTMVFLDAKSLGNYLHCKKQVLDKIKKHEYDFTALSNNSRDNKIFTTKKIKNTYKLQVLFKCPQKELKDKFLNRISSGGYALLAEEQVLEEFSRKYWAVYQRYQIGVKMIEGIMVKQEQFSEYDNHIFFMKGVHTPLNNSFLDFLAVKIQDMKEGSKLIVYGLFKAKKGFSTDLAIPFLLEFGNMIGRKVKEHVADKIKEQSSLMKEDLKLKSKIDSVQNIFSIQESSDSLVEEVRPSEVGFLPNLKHQFSTRLANGRQENRYLSHSFRQDPLKKTDKPILCSQHPAFCDWDRKKQGGLVCVNQEKLNSQKGVVIKIVSKVRKQIMNGKSLLEISLPISVFSKESHLTTIAFSFSLAPRLLEPVVNQPALEKMKHALTFLIGTALTGVSVTKPFNPILGETVQTWIDGCPMYLQQISHHPPIGYYLFYGRGYKLYGSIKLDINLGLNSLIANSLLPHYISFDNGDTLIMKHSLTQVSGGFLFGDRELFLIEKTWVFDTKNRLFGEVRYGPRNTGFFSRSSEPLDFVEVEISKVTDQFAINFDINNPYPSKKDIISELSKGQGTWTSIFQIDGKKIIDFQTDFPSEMVDQEFPLPSNGTYRLDLVKFIEGDIDEAQDMKDQMEDLQRYDKQLREGNAKKCCSRLR